MYGGDYEDDDVTYVDDYDDEDDVDLNQDDEFYVNDGEDAKNPSKDFRVLSEEEIRCCQEDDIDKICNLLSLSSVNATTLLCYYNWDVDKVQDEWFTDEAKVREKVGLSGKRTVLKYSKAKTKVNCPICFDSHRRSSMKSAACGHLYCKDCWKGYIRTAISDGAGCLGLRCPDPSCSVSVDRDMIDDLASKGDRLKYSQFVLRSYVENSKKIKWCPAPDCNFAVHSDAGCGTRTLEVLCRCLFHFCWNCKEEAHSPIDCDTTAKWIAKNNADGENVTWLLAYTKPCPKCKRNIEKNNGCMHMTCRAPCKHEFCWLCLGDWKGHDRNFYECNRYKRDLKLGIYDENEKRMEMAKRSIDRYTHYYERWAANHSSMQKARSDLQKLGTEHMKILSVKLGAPEAKLSFLTVAWMQVIECRRVLKWSYACGYYLPENEKANKDLFEYSQGLAEQNLEKLHREAEESLQIFLNAEEAPEKFWELKSKLMGMTVVTKNFFENLVRYLENGIPEVASDEDPPRKKARKEVKQQEDGKKSSEDTSWAAY